MSDDPLDQLNRFIIVAGALVGVFIALLVALLAWGAPGDTITRIADFADYLRHHNDRETKAIISLAAAVVVLLMLTAIIVELTPSPARKMRVRSMTSGEGVITTAQIAKRIGKPNAVRAVAGACAANRLAVAIPCHRVLRSDGSLSGYRWGEARKRALLAKEGG